MQQAPSWFTQAVQTPFESGRLQVDKLQIHYRTWGQADKPGILLLHGGMAHVAWWSFLAPFFCENYFVVAFDLSGHGDSDRRETYAFEQWAAEVAAVAQALPFTGKPLLVGHSMGGLIATSAAARYPDLFAATTVIDAPLHRYFGRSSNDAEAEGGPRFGQKTFATLDEAKLKFRLLPPQTCDNSFIINFLAEHSLTQTNAGWRWKFDPTLFDHQQRVHFGARLAEIKTPLAFIRGEFSKVAPSESRAYLQENYQGRLTFIEIPHANHHLVLDQPIAFVAALRTVFSCWRAHGLLPAAN